MNRKHFNALAAEINAVYTANRNDVVVRGAIAELAGRIARVCADSNPNFSDARFIKACGLPTTEVIAA